MYIMFYYKGMTSMVLKGVMRFVMKRSKDEKMERKKTPRSIIHLRE